MIEVRKKRYQITLWVGSREEISEPGLRLEFDALEEATAALEHHRRMGLYRSGVMLDWRPDLQAWFFLDGYGLS